MENMTAKVSCFARAYHYKNNNVCIFADSAAEKLLGRDYDAVAGAMSQGVNFFMPDYHGSTEDGLHLIVDRQLSPSVLGRSTYCENMLGNEIRLGCTQYLIFASGYDTYAVRNNCTELSVYELDLPEMMEDKKKRAEEAGLSSAAVYVHCDLSDTSWRDKLIGCGFDPQKRSFGSLLGITYYLEKDELGAVLKTLWSIMCEGSAICFDYPAGTDSRETKTNRMLARGAGEQMKARYSYRDMEALLDECGFLIYEHLDHEEMTGQYFGEYNRSCPGHPMEAPDGVCYALAVRKRQRPQ